VADADRVRVRYGGAVHRLLLLHGGNPLDELLIAAAGALFLIGGYIAIKMAPAPEGTDERPTEVAEATQPEPGLTTQPPPPPS
jgi:hypothetical protein